jgi:hypothetical protein
MRDRLSALLAAVSLAAVACGGPWTVDVYNNDGDQPVGVRLRLEDGQRSWVLQPQQMDTLIRDDSRHAVTLELFDPANCSVLASEELPEGSGVLVLVHQGVTGEGPWQIDAGIESGGENAVLEPNFEGCR